MPHGDELDAGLFGKSEDVFRSPVGVGVESVNYRFPGVDSHDEIKHFWTVDLDNNAIKDGGVDGFGEFDEPSELGVDAFGVGEFGVGDDVDVGAGLHELNDVGGVETVVFVVSEMRDEVVVVELEVFGAGGVFVPGGAVMFGDGFAIGSEDEIDFKDAVAELVVEEEGFVGIGISVAENAAHGVCDIGMVGPRVVEMIGWSVAGNIDDVGSLLGVGGGVLVETEETNASANGGEHRDSANDNNGDFG